jgi:pimeloyl-ACP methyl ester carboxylesterase
VAVKVTVTGIDLAVEVRGEGAPVLFVHGFPFDRAMWRHQLAALPGWRRIAPDLRGAGESGAPRDGYSMARYADDLALVLDSLEIEAAVVCGLSMGGYILFELLRRHPTRVRAAILCNTKAEADSAEAKRGRDELAGVAEREGPSAVADRLLPRVLAPATVEAHPDVAAVVRTMIERTPVPGIVGALRAMRDRVDSMPLLGTLRLPVLVVAGAEDRIAPPEGMRAMAQAISGARVVEIAAAAHLTPLEQPRATNEALTDFLNGLG